MTSEAIAYCIALCCGSAAIGVQLGAIWGARIVRSEAMKREQGAYDEGYNDGCTRRPRRWHR
jgi:hypothetical protein